VPLRGDCVSGAGIGACSLPEALEVHIKLSWAGVIPLQEENEASPLKKMSCIRNKLLISNFMIRCQIKRTGHNQETNSFIHSNLL
jgi:hypothetical protein